MAGRLAGCHVIETCRAERYTWWRGIRASTLTPTARHVGLTIATYMDKDGAGAWPSLATLADDTGRSRRTVARAVGELRELGFLEVESGGGRRGGGGYVSNRYVALIPVSVVMGDMAPARNGDTDDTDSGESEGNADAGTVTPEHGAVTSQQGTVSPVTGNGDTGGTRSTQELATEEPKEEPMLRDFVAAPDGAEKEPEGKFELGARYRARVDDGTFTAQDVEKLARFYEGEDADEFWRGFQQGTAA